MGLTKFDNFEPFWIVLTFERHCDSDFITFGQQASILEEKDDDQTSITPEQDNQSVDFNYSNFPDAQDPDALGFENYDIWS